MSLADFDDILLICCNWDTNHYKYEMMELVESVPTNVMDLDALKATKWWEKAERAILFELRKSEAEKEAGVLV